VQEYVNGIEYRGTAIPATTIEGIYHAEGRLYNNAGTWQREYIIKDHLGDTRITYCDIDGDGVIATPSEILQENNYDAFGYGLDGVYMNHSNPDNLYQYNGKEKNDDHGIGMYDYGARWYDAGVGRWNTVDPMANENNSYSPFLYTGNNPVLMIDPDGQDWIYYDSRGAEIRRIGNDKPNQYYDAVSNKDGTITVSGERSSAPKPAEEYGTYGGIFGRINVSQSAGGAFSSFGANTILKAAELYSTGEIMGWALKPLGGLFGKLFSNTVTMRGSSWVYGAFKTEAKWAGQLSKRGWTAEQITEAVTKGKSFEAVNLVNKANSATRYVHPITGKSVVIDNVTKELLHVGGPGFKY
jgi:RHS repeat-associated protein